ncbi:MAG: 1-(5-phosphoribosyl)-5-[(5-phosphoribosylamino)methylideneamino]imidazole-4-carboxamide isomerase [Cyanobacteria bacterium J06641_5]
MLEVIPAIDILGGKCVRLYQGDYAQSEVFGDDPATMAQRWAAEGATRLHLVDLDGAKSGEPTNTEAIAAVVAALDIPVQVGGGLRDRDRIAALFDLGVERAIVGTIAVEQPELVRQLCQEFPGKIVVGIDARQGKVATRGWLETSEISAVDLARQMDDFGAAAIIYTDIQRDGTLTGPNREALQELAEAISIPTIASGGIGSVTDLLNLLALVASGVNGAIVGRAIYNGDIVLSEALLAVGQGRWQDVPPDFETTTLA